MNSSECKKIFNELTNLNAHSVYKLGGMSNINYLIKTIDNQQFVLRIPGTNIIINRKRERIIQEQTECCGLNVKSIYFNEENGIKITKFMPTSITLKPYTIGKYIQKIAKKLKFLHNSNMEFVYEFNPFDEMSKYLSLIKEGHKFDRLNLALDIFLSHKKTIFEINQKYYGSDLILMPTHGDLVPENILINGDEILIIDWEYAGFNDPCWDIASLIIESNLSQNLQEEFFKAYNINNIEFEKLQIYKSLVDILWSIWAVVKSDKNNDYLTYANARLDAVLKRERI